LGVHEEPQTLGVPPPPHVPVAHVPHWMMLPQPSLMGPQLAPAEAQVTAVAHVAPPSPWWPES
jgi:hypothetical protein